MTMVIRIPPVPPDLPPGTMMVSQEVLSKLHSDELESLVKTLSDPHRQIELLYEGEDHRVESVQTPTGTEVWVIVVVARGAALVILPVEPQEDGLPSTPDCVLN
jgi:hypothetical protein